MRSLGGSFLASTIARARQQIPSLPDNQLPMRLDQVVCSTCTQDVRNRSTLSIIATARTRCFHASPVACGLWPVAFALLELLPGHSDLLPGRRRAHDAADSAPCPVRRRGCRDHPGRVQAPREQPRDPKSGDLRQARRDRGIRRLCGVWHPAVRAADAGAIAYCAQGSVRSALLARLAGYRDRVGFDTSAGRWLYTRRVTYRSEQHHAERLLATGRGRRGTSSRRRRLPRRSIHQPADRDAVESLLASHDAGHGERLIALAPGSVWATKRWPGFPALARSLAVTRTRRHHRRNRRPGTRGRDHLDRAQLRSTPPDGSRCLRSTELIRRAALLVTNDSLPQHLASAMGTPTLTIFGPTVPGFGFGPLAPGHRHRS